MNHQDCTTKAVIPKVLFIVVGLHTGGAETMLYRLLASNNQKGWEARVVSLLKGGKYTTLLEQAGVKVDTLNLRGGIWTLMRFWRIARIKQIVTDFEPDIIQGWMYHGNFLAVLFKNRRRKIFWNIRQSLGDLSREHLMMRILIRLCAHLSPIVDTIIYNSEAGAVDHKQLGFHSATTEVVPNGFDLTYFDFSSSVRDSYRRQLNVANDVFMVGTIGRFDPLKDYKTFIAAAEIVKRTAPSVQFLMVGNGLDRSNRLLASWIEHAGLGGSIILLGEANSSLGALNALDVFVLSSSAEGFPNVVGEAMAVGVTCVLTDVGDVRTIVGCDAMVCPPGDPAALAAGILTVIADPGTNSDEQRQLRRKRIFQNFTLEKIVNRYQDLYKPT